MMSLEDFEKICLPWSTATYTYSNAREIQWAKWLNGFLIHNVGTTEIYFNNDRIEAGESKAYGGNRGEIYKGPMDFRFFTQSPPPITVINLVTITQKFYLFPE